MNARGRRRARSSALALAFLLLLPLLPSCQWLQNEFLALDVASPAPEPPPAQTAPW